MNKMKLLAPLLILPLAACGPKDKEKEETNPIKDVAIQLAMKITGKEEANEIVVKDYPANGELDGADLFAYDKDGLEFYCARFFEKIDYDECVEVLDEFTEGYVVNEDYSERDDDEFYCSEFVTKDEITIFKYVEGNDTEFYGSVYVMAESDIEDYIKWVEKQNEIDLDENVVATANYIQEGLGDKFYYRWVEGEDMLCIQAIVGKDVDTTAEAAIGTAAGYLPEAFVVEEPAEMLEEDYYFAFYRNNDEQLSVELYSFVDDGDVCIEFDIYYELYEED